MPREAMAQLVQEREKTKLIKIIGKKLQRITLVLMAKTYMSLPGSGPALIPLCILTYLILTKTQPDHCDVNETLYLVQVTV